MPIVTVKNGRAELRNDRGSLLRSIGNNIVDADVSDECMVTVTARGAAELRSPSGNLIKTMVSRDCTGCSRWRDRCRGADSRRTFYLRFARVAADCRPGSGVGTVDRTADPVGRDTAEPALSG